MIPYRLMHRLDFTPWERRNVAEFWRPLFELAGGGWQVTAVEFVDKALAGPGSGRLMRASRCGGSGATFVRRLGLEPGYDLLYDFDCIQGLPDTARRGAAAGPTELGAPGARLLFLAFKSARRIMLPRGVEREHLVRHGGQRLGARASRVGRDRGHAPPVRRAQPTLYRLARRAGVPG